MLGRVLDLLRLSEGTCVLCGSLADSEDQGFVCESCLGSIEPERVGVRKDLGPVKGYRVFGRYGGSVGEIIKLVKFKQVLPLARRLGKVLSPDLRAFVKEVEPEVVTFVPVHIFRLWGRGFDQNEEMLKGAGVEFKKVLVRVKHSKPLASLKGEERRRVVAGSFRVAPSKLGEVRGKRILVFDDVVTTGATAVSVASELLSRGAKEVFFYFVSSED